MGRIATDKTEVLEFIKHADHPVTSKEIVENTKYSGDAKHLMKYLVTNYDEIQRVGERSRSAYIWKPAPEKAVYSEMKNHEGYPDSTAGKAIANVMRKSDGKNHRGFKFGEVYSCKDVKDDMEGVLVISSKVGTVIGLNVYPVKKDFMKDGYFIEWPDKRGKHFASTVSIVNVSERKLRDKIFEISSEKKVELTGHITNVMDIQMPVINFDILEPKEVVKEVVKEVPIEVIKEVEVIKPIEIHAEEREIEEAVMRTKIRIYERLIFGENLVLQKTQKIQAV